MSDVELEAYWTGITEENPKEKEFYDMVRQAITANLSSMKQVSRRTIQELNSGPMSEKD